MIVSTLNLTQSLVRIHSGKSFPLHSVLNVTGLALHEINSILPVMGKDRVTESAHILLAVQAVLFQAIVCQQIAVITVMPYFNILTSRLFRFTLTVCEEELLNTCCPSAKSVAERCAQSVSSLITTLCNLRNFQPFAPQLLIEFVDRTHSHHLHPQVKHIFQSCVYRLLRAIRNRYTSSLERLQVRLDQPKRELLKQIIANYELFFRYKGYV